MLERPPCRLRLEILGAPEFSARAVESAGSLPNVELVYGQVDPHVRLFDPVLAAGASRSETGVVVVAPWLIAWADADDSSAVSRADVVATAVMLAYPGTSAQGGPHHK